MGIVAVVLAAGRGTRFGSDKLAAPIGDRSVLERSIAAALAAPVERVIVVARPHTAVPSDPRVIRVEARGPALSDSLRAGIAAADEAEGAFIFLGDMPLVPPELAGRLSEAIGQAIAAVPMRDGRPGHPVLLARAGFALAERLRGDAGLGALLRGRADVVELAVREAGATLDIDTQSDIAAAQRLLDG
jgi:molybdenum cofactor cytidylyltransferase